MISAPQVAIPRFRNLGLPMDYPPPGHYDYCGETMVVTRDSHHQFTKQHGGCRSAANKCRFLVYSFGEERSWY